MRHAVVIETAGEHISVYVPNLPGCVATGETINAVAQEIKAAIRFHLDGLEEDGLTSPQPSALAEYVDA